MTILTAAARRGLFVGLAAALLPSGVAAFAALAVAAGPAASGAKDPCSASEVARTIGSVSKSMGDYLDSHPQTNQTMSALLQEQAGPQSLGALKTYFEANPKVATDMQKISDPLTGLSLQCKLPISIPQAMGLMQQTQAGALPGGAAGALPSRGAPAGTPPAATVPVPPATTPLPGPPRGNTVG